MSNGEPTIEISTIRTRLENIHVDLRDFWVGFMPEDPSTLRIYSLDDVGLRKSFVEPLGFGPPSDVETEGYTFKLSAKPYRSLAAGFWLDSSRQQYTKADWALVEQDLGRSDRLYGSFEFPEQPKADPADKFPSEGLK